MGTASSAVIIFILSEGAVLAQGTLSDIYRPEIEKSYISPAYFGPDAFPVPDMLVNTSDRLELEIGTSVYGGYCSSTTDRTLAIDFSVRIPLWSGRANLRIWGQAHEWYEDTAEARVIRRVSPDQPLVGGCPGDVNFSIDMRILEEREYRPCITLRAACKSASGDNFERARYYDCPGYFFDICVNKTLPLGDVDLTVAGTTGFLCWQVDNGRQNDAAMYGVSLTLQQKVFKACTEWGGYSGWKQDGDRPMTLKVRADIFPEAMFSPFLQYQHGFLDWPFDQVKIGMRCNLELPKK